MSPVENLQPRSGFAARALFGFQASRVCRSSRALLANLRFGLKGEDVRQSITDSPPDLQRVKEPRLLSAFAGFNGNAVAKGKFLSGQQGVALWRQCSGVFRNATKSRK